MAQKQKDEIDYKEVIKGMRCRGCGYVYPTVILDLRCDCMVEPSYDSMVIISEKYYNELVKGA